MPKLGYPFKVSDKKTKHFWRLADGAAPADDDERSSSIIRMMMMLMLRCWIAGNGNETGNGRERGRAGEGEGEWKTEELWLGLRKDI